MGGQQKFQGSAYQQPDFSDPAPLLGQMKVRWAQVFGREGGDYGSGVGTGMGWGWGGHLIWGGRGAKR